MLCSINKLTWLDLTVRLQRTTEMEERLVEVWQQHNLYNADRAAYKHFSFPLNVLHLKINGS